MRRGFTLLEVTIAFSMGMIIVATCLALMASMTRTDSRMQTRHEQRMELSRARLTMQRAMTSLVMDDSPQAQAEVIKPPTRLSLHEAPSEGAVRLFNRARLVGVDLGDPQRFEVVVSRPPSAIHSRLTVDALPDDAYRDDGLGLADDEVELTHRGAFELWPDDTLPGTRHAESAWDDCEGMTLWWVPVTDDEGHVPGSIPLVSGLATCSWRVMHKSKRQTEYEATWVVDLPGFVEFEAHTNTGIHVNWLFEVVWREGPEVLTVDQEQDGDEERGGGGANGADAPPRGGAPTVGARPDGGTGR